jgi:hypothetical protein
MKKDPSFILASTNINGPIRITGIYLILSVLWILFSDQLTEKLAANRALLTEISIYKGWIYVMITALLLYGMV